MNLEDLATVVVLCAMSVNFCIGFLAALWAF